MPLLMTRREFLLANGALGSAAILSTIPWSLTWRVLNREECQTLLVVARTLFPHEQADDTRYQQAIDAIEARCGAEKGVEVAVRSGITLLDERSGDSFKYADRRTRVALLKSAETSAFFQIVYQETLDTLYGTHCRRMGPFRSMPGQRQGPLRVGVKAENKVPLSDRNECWQMPIKTDRGGMMNGGSTRNCGRSNRQWPNGRNGSIV